jgi:DNA-binding beta-propeller fold protein YncE
VGWDAAGNIFVADGYGNSRVVKFDKNGKFIKTWGTRGTGEGQFRLPHSIIQDNRGRLLIGDRCGLSTSHCVGARIEIFDTDGKYLDQWPTLGGDDRFPMSSPATLYYIPKTDLVYVTASSKIMVADAKTGKVMNFIETAPGLVNHGIAVNHEGDVFAAGIDHGGLVRYTRRAVQ